MQITPQNWRLTFEQFGFGARRCGNSNCRKTSFSNALRRCDSYLLNRKDWFCSATCLESALAFRLESLTPGNTRALALSRMPLGLLLLGQGVIRDDELRSAIALHKRTGRRIGACLCSMGATTESDVASALSKQWACALFPVHSIQRGCASLIPAAILRRHEMLPVHFTAASRTLYIAFAHGIDYAALYAIEQMLECHTEPCIIPDRVILEGIETRCTASENERTLRYPASALEVAHIAVSYAKQCGADELNYVSVGQDLWARVAGQRAFMDITFDASERSVI
jgi:hypothetical protein